MNTVKKLSGTLTRSLSLGILKRAEIWKSYRGRALYKTGFVQEPQKLNDGKQYLVKGYIEVSLCLEQVKLSLCLTNRALRHESVWRSGCIPPCCFHLGTSWRRVLRFTSLPIISIEVGDL
jgi:hypothetical protein